MENFITNVDILDESKECFLTYAEEVLTDRSIPAAEDGLLSVHRKIIWTVENILKMDNKSKYKKSASLVGSTLSSSYYHGDAACYGALCKLAQPYLMRYPLIDGEGNFGTQEGNGLEASSRYTNARPSIYADLMYTNYNKNVVPTKPTYNEEYMEPVILPALLPNAIVNGRESVGVAMAHGSLPHNLKEACNAIIAYIKKGNLTTDELLEYMPGPDFPLGNVIINSKDVRTAYETGHSATSLKVRGDYEIKGNEIIFNTIPYRTYRNKIKEQINKNIDVLEQVIDDFRDESNVGINKLVFVVKKDIPIENALNKLFALTDLQTTLSYNMNFIVNGTPKLCSMIDLIDSYYKHQTNCSINAATFDKNKAEKRKHILEGLIIITKDIDNAIKIIKNAETPKDAETQLITKYKISQEQAKAVLELKLSRLTRLNRDDLLKELEEKKELLIQLNKVVNDKEYRDSHVIIPSIENIRDKYGDERRTKLLNLDIPKEEKKTIEIIPEDVVVLLDKDSNIKRISSTSFKVQNRKGKGTKSDKNIVASIPTNTIDSLMVFTSLGRMFKIPVNDIPIGSEKGKGVNLFSLLSLENNEYVITMSSLYKNTNAEYIVFLTKNGMIKKSKIEEYKSLKKSGGIAAIKLKENDSVVYVTFLKDEDMFIISKKGQVIHIETKNINPIGRVTMGVKGITLRENDYVVTGLPLHKETDYLAIVTTCGYGKKMPLSEFPVQGRGGIGILGKKKVEKGKNDDPIAGAAMVDDNDVLLIIGQPNKIAIPVDQIPLLKRTSEGLKLIADSYVNVIGKI